MSSSKLTVMQFLSRSICPILSFNDSSAKYPDGFVIGYVRNRNFFTTELAARYQFDHRNFASKRRIFLDRKGSALCGSSVPGKFSEQILPDVSVVR
jgi:hypothetical protein